MMSFSSLSTLVFFITSAVMAHFLGLDKIEVILSEWLNPSMQIYLGVAFAIEMAHWLHFFKNAEKRTGELGQKIALGLAVSLSLSAAAVVANISHQALQGMELVYLLILLSHECCNIQAYIVIKNISSATSLTAAKLSEQKTSDELPHTTWKARRRRIQARGQLATFRGVSV